MSHMSHMQLQQHSQSMILGPGSMHVQPEGHYSTSTPR